MDGLRGRCSWNGILTVRLSLGEGYATCMGVFVFPGWVERRWDIFVLGQVSWDKLYCFRCCFLACFQVVA